MWRSYSALCTHSTIVSLHYYCISALYLRTTTIEITTHLIAFGLLRLMAANPCMFVVRVSVRRLTLQTVYRGARKGRGLVISPKDYSTKYRY